MYMAIEGRHERLKYCRSNVQQSELEGQAVLCPFLSLTTISRKEGTSTILVQFMFCSQRECEKFGKEKRQCIVVLLFTRMEVSILSRILLSAVNLLNG